MEAKEAVLRLEIYVPFNTSKMTEQQALDKLEEVVNEIEETHGVTTVVHERKIQKSLEV